MFNDPRVSDRLQGLELRVIELTRKLRDARRRRSWSRGARLQRERQRLFAEMAEISHSPEQSPTPRIHARRVRNASRGGGERPAA